MPPLFNRRRLTVDEFHRVTRIGILREDDRVELIDGELIHEATVTGRHLASVNCLTQAFQHVNLRSPGRFIVSVRNPVRLSHHTEPFTDLALLRPRRDEYATRLPGPDDVLLLAEVSDTSLRYDRRVKLPLYATAGIADTWIVNLPRRTVEVHRDPHGSRYQQVTVFRRGERVSLLAFPEIAIAVDDILP